MTSGGLRSRSSMGAEPTETMLKQRVRTLEIVAQPARGCGAVLACKRLHARSAKELPVHADQKRRSDACIASIDPFLFQRPGQRLRERRHHLEFLRAQRLRVLERAREGDEPRAGQARALAHLHTPQRVEYGLALGPRPDRFAELSRALVNLVEEEIFLRREVIEDGFLRHTGVGGDLGYGHVVEAALDEQPHRHVGNLLPRRELLRLPQAHARSVAFWLLSP